MNKNEGEKMPSPKTTPKLNLCGFLKRWKKVEKTFFLSFFLRRSGQITCRILIFVCEYCESHFFCINLLSIEQCIFCCQSQILLSVPSLKCAFVVDVLRMCMGGPMRVFLLGQRKKKVKKNQQKMSQRRKKISRTSSKSCENILSLVYFCVFCNLEETFCQGLFTYLFNVRLFSESSEINK